MKLEYDNIIIREAISEDVEQLRSWWNDGMVMEHAGFPDGLGISSDEMKDVIRKSNGGLHMVIYKNIPIGEINYSETDVDICQIGIKICDFTRQNQGLGKVILSLFINALFNDYGYQKIILDTNLSNSRSQYVYEQLGFEKIRINHNSWKDQLGRWQSSVDYELTKDSFISFLEE